MTDQAASFGERLRSHRERRGMTQEELGERAGLSGQAVGVLERGVRRRPYAQTVRALARALDLSATEEQALIRSARSGRGAPEEPVRVPPAPGGLVVPLTPLIGRQSETIDVCLLLEREQIRLLSLTGPGGVGKTRLALRVATLLEPVFPDGVSFVALAAISSAPLVPATIAQALGLREGEAQPIAHQLLTFLQNRRLLLVLDNLEQLLPAGPFVADLLVACPGVKVLGTSRAPLHLQGEQEYRVPPLSLPDLRDLPPISTLEENEAVALFVQRTRAIRPAFALTNSNAPAVAEVCARLDGLPLAIELAAARGRVLSPPALLARLTNRLTLLTGGPYDQPSRLQTMRNAIAWSYDLLSAEERTLFRRLAVFVSGCTLDAAEAVAGARGWGLGARGAPTSPTPSPQPPAPNVLDGITSLVDKSLLQQFEQADGEPRFVMLETIREYALEQLSADPGESSLRRMHAAYYVALAEQAEPGAGRDQATWLARLDADYDNVRAALTWLAAAGDEEPLLRAASALPWYWYLRGHWNEGRAWLDRALDQERTAGVSPAVRALALRRGGSLARGQGRHQDARIRLEQSLALFDTIGDVPGAARVVVILGTMAGNQNDDERAATLFEEALTRFRTTTDVRGLALCLTYLGDTVFRQGDLVRSAALTAEALSLLRTLDDNIDTAFALGNAAQVALALGNADDARTQYEEGLGLSLEIGDKLGVADAVAGIAAVEGLAGRAERSARLLGAAQALCLVVSAHSVPHHGQFARARLMAERDLPAAAFASAWAAGQALSLDEVVAEATARGSEVAPARRLLEILPPVTDNAPAAAGARSTPASSG